MKKIEAYVRPEKLEDIKDALKSSVISGITVSQVMGCGNQKGRTEIVRGTEIEVFFRPKIKIEIVVMDEQVDPLIDLICENAWTGEVGDGKIFVTNVEDAVRIRTKEKGITAI
jgi:nitrogen regulatory protein P-II 1